MKNILIRLLPAFFLLFAATKGVVNAQDSPTNEYNPARKSLLWKAEPANGGKAIYIYGTMHLMPKEDFYLGPGLRKTFLGSDVLIMELELNEESMIRAMGKMWLPEGKTLEELMNKEAFDSLKSYLLDTLRMQEMQYKMVIRMKPFLATQLFYSDMMGESPASFEMVFKSMADSAGLQIAGLETIEEQIAVIDSIPLDEQIEMLMQGVRGENEFGDDFSTMISIYKSQDIDSLYRYMMSDAADLMEYEDVLLRTRNRNWAEKITELDKNRSYFIAVGAGHLAGPYGLLHLLEEKNYSVTPLSTE